ncbi:uncharacterized protein LOC132747533 [Ruditapes philippinarum]|uniref:uncharacterized protein LOC132747533 n=1 Tax=Ruditapes philippinarum TaxID=129788 RepID=UPI00295B9C91|nr:uncharacterized protein LOC132747533 [Ruditapes philippinarum]
MARPKLGAFIRNINYLSAKDGNDYEDSNENPSNQLIDYERLCNYDKNFSLEEFTDGYGAFREKVCVSEFPGRHSPPYWVAYSTVCVLDRLKRNFTDEVENHAQIGQEIVYTWLALLTAKPSSGHLDLMSKFSGDMFEQYVKACKCDELVKILSRMKIEFSYDAEHETDEEQTYGSLLDSNTVAIFRYITEEQWTEDSVLAALLDLRMFFQQQIGKLSPSLGRYVGYLVRDMTSKYTTNICEPYKKFTDIKAITSHLSIIEESVCTFDGDLKDLRDEDTLEEIVKAARVTLIVKELFPAFMKLITNYSKRKSPLQNGGRLFDVYRLHLFRDMEKHLEPDSGMFDACCTMIVDILTNPGKLDNAVQEMISEAISHCLLKVKPMTHAQSKTLLNVLLTMLKSGRIKLTSEVNRTLLEKEFTKSIEWKNVVSEAKQFLNVVRTLRGDQLEHKDGGDYYKIVRELEKCVEILLQLYKKGKILKDVLNEHVALIIDLITFTEPNKAEIADAASESKYLVVSLKDKEIQDQILDKVDSLLKQPDKEWDIYQSRATEYLLEAVILSYKGNGKNVTDQQNEKFMSIFDTCCEGDSLEDKLIHPDEDHGTTVFYQIYTTSGLKYISLHNESKTLSRCTPLIKNILKWARISVEEQHTGPMEASLHALHLVANALSPELADITPEVVDLFLSIDKVSNLTHILRGLYSLNPEPVHVKLQLFIDKMDEMIYTERVCIASLLVEVSGKCPQIFTGDQVDKLFELAFEDDQSQQLYFHILNQIAAQCPATVYKLFSKIQNETRFNSSSTIFRAMIVVRIACHDKKLTNEAADFALKQLAVSDHTNTIQILHQLLLLARANREDMLQYKEYLEKMEESSNAPDVKESCRNIINVIEGKSIEGVIEDIQQAQEDIDDLDKKVGATMNTVVSLGDHVIEQGKDISKVRDDVGNLGERVDNVEEGLTDTKVKVEEIDNKTMTNAPKWSRDLTKLLNPKAENDWRLLAKRLQYSNDDIRAWAQQHDPCMALLSEWYATHKTSEANFAILNNLQEMNRLDGAIIVENAMKATEDVVEDDEFEYPSPPPIFLSYQWGVQNEVKLLKQHLNMAGYECWMDIGQMGGGDKLFNKIDNGIRGAKVIICCTTEKYAQSPNCNREVNLSVNLGKPIIPLLMEKMSWPPKGSMGPIFSEYLFIRFFQRNGEETKDQRYWPVAKFQELLMQLNFYTVPDPSLIKQEYSNWWNPIVEEIKIDKNKNAKGTEVSKTNTNGQDVDESPLVFLSYQWGRQPQVKLLYERLVSRGYTVWMDIFQMGGGDSLYDKIDRGMRGCKVVVSCVTPKYALSANCRREISLADALKKPIIPLVLEAMTWPPDGPMSMVFTELLFINVHRDQQIQEKWTGPKVDELMGKLKIYIPDNEQIHSGGNDKNDSNTPTKSEPEKSKTEHTPSSLLEYQTKTTSCHDRNSRTILEACDVQKQEKVDAESDKNQGHHPKKSESQTSKSCILL